MSQSLRRLALPLILCLAGMAGAAEPAPPVALPEALEACGLKAAGPAEHYAGQKLFDYMDGGAEVFLAYGFTDLWVRPYKAPGGGSLHLALYAMGTPAGAAGIFLAGGRGRAADVGVPALQTPQMVSFFRGPVYVRVVLDAGADKDGQALLALGRAVAGALTGEAALPAVLGRLPDGAADGTRRFLTLPDTARTVWFGGEGDGLLAGGALAAYGAYPAGEVDVLLAAVEYPDAERAAKACAALVAGLGLKAGAGGSCRAEGKGSDDAWHALAVEGPVLRWAAGADKLETARGWLQKIR